MKVLNVLADVVAAVEAAYEIHLPKAEFNYCFVAVDRVINLAHTEGAALIEMIAFNGAGAGRNRYAATRSSYMQTRPGRDRTAEVYPRPTPEQVNALRRAWAELFRFLLAQGKLDKNIAAAADAFGLDYIGAAAAEAGEAGTLKRIYELEPRYAELATKRREGELNDAELIEAARADAELAELFNDSLPWLYSFLRALDDGIRYQCHVQERPAYDNLKLRGGNVMRSIAATATVNDVAVMVAAAYEKHLPRGDFGPCFIAVDCAMSLAHGSAAYLANWEGVGHLQRVREWWVWRDVLGLPRADPSPERARAWVNLYQYLLDAGKFDATLGRAVKTFCEKYRDDGDVDDAGIIETLKRIYEVEPRYAEIAARRREGGLGDGELIEATKLDAELTGLFAAALTYLYTFLVAFCMLRKKGSPGAKLPPRFTLRPPITKAASGARLPCTAAARGQGRPDNPKKSASGRGFKRAT